MSSADVLRQLVDATPALEEGAMALDRVPQLEATIADLQASLDVAAATIADLQASLDVAAATIADLRAQAGDSG